MTVPDHPLSPEMQRVYDDGVRAAAAGANILILGEVGAGKEVLATWLHAASPRAHEPLLAVNLAAIPVGYDEEDLYGSQLAGARIREGALERAHGGVVLLDEIGEFEVNPLRKLRAALQARSVLPAGASERVPADVQFFALTSRNLHAEIDAGERSPEYLEMADVTLVVPPLRERRSEIRPLARHFVAVVSAELGFSTLGISAPAMAALETHICEGAEIGLEHLPDRIAGR
jgi:anaerobic nitric oxide reductase transcription regulator